MLLSLNKVVEERKAQPVKNFEPQIDRPRTAIEAAKRPSSNQGARPPVSIVKPKPTGYQVGYSNPNNVGQKPKYVPPPVSAEEIRRREEKERERDEQK